jgi:hypothetical protein
VPADPGSNKVDQPYNYNSHSESLVDFQIMQIGANIISQFQTANFPPQIDFNDGASIQRTIVGVANLPYLANIITGVLQMKSPDPMPNDRNLGRYDPGQTLKDEGVGALVQLPVIWNPHDPSSSIGAVGPTNFRVFADSAAPDSGAIRESYFVYAGSSVQASGGGWYTDPSAGTKIAHQFTADNTAIEFQIPTPGAASRSLFPEPTLMMRPGSFKDLNGNNVTVKLTPNHLMKKDPLCPLLSSYQGPNGGLRNYAENALAVQNPPEPKDSAGTPYVGFYLGAFPLAWTQKSATKPTSAQETGVNLAKPTGAPPGQSASCYFTYRMQYQDSSGAWITYDTKYGKVANGVTSFNLERPSLICGISGAIGSPNNSGFPSGSGYWAMATDPRTSRFGLLWNGTTGVKGTDAPEKTGSGSIPLPGPEMQAAIYPNIYPIKYGAGYLDKASGAIYSIRPDAQSGFYSMQAMMGWDTQVSDFVNGLTGWRAQIGSAAGYSPGLCLGLLSQNNTDIRFAESSYYGQGQGTGTVSPNYFADPDGIVRRAMGAFVPLGTANSPTANSLEGNSKLPSADTTVGLPMARTFNWTWGQPSNPCPTETKYTSPIQVTSQAQSRPYFLHRPFRSVAELGCVFSDTPWRNLDFSTAESGSTALLDVFCINDNDDASGLIAGKVSLNTRQETVLKAILAGGCIDLAQPQSTHAMGRLDAKTSGLLAQALITRTTNTTADGAGPLVNVSDLIGKFVSKQPIQPFTPVSGPILAPLSAGTFSDGKLSDAGFSGGAWDTGNHGPKSSSPAMDVYSAYQTSGTFSPSLTHNGTRESMSYIQRFREAPIRALAAAGQTRVWNLMLDVVAQSGKFPITGASFNNFSVQAEQRYWVHLAIDRLTGEVLDKQVEVVKE